MSLLKSINNKSHLRNKSTIIQLISNGYPNELNLRTFSHSRNNVYNKRKYEDFFQKTEPNEKYIIRNKEKFLQNIIKGKNEIENFNEISHKDKFKNTKKKKNSFEKLTMEFLLNQISNFTSQEITNSRFYIERSSRRSKRKTNSENNLIQKKEIEIEINNNSKINNYFHHNNNLSKILNNRYNNNNSSNILNSNNGSFFSSYKKNENKSSINFSILSSVSSKEDNEDNLSNNEQKSSLNNLNNQMNYKKKERNVLTNLILSERSISMSKELSNIEHLYISEDFQDNKPLETILTDIKVNENDFEDNVRIDDEEMTLKNSLKLIIAPDKYYFQTITKNKEYNTFLNSNINSSFKHKMNPFLIIENDKIKTDKFFHEIITEGKNQEINNGSPIKIISRKDSICSDGQYKDWDDASLDNENDEIDIPLPNFINEIKKDEIKINCIELLNLITVDNYNIIKKKIIDFIYNKPINQEKLIDVLFYKAIYENKFRSLYVKLCKDLDKILADKKIKMKSAMRNKLLDNCKKNFKNIKNSISDINYAIGNICFLSDLINIQMVSKKVGTQTINNLINKYYKYEKSNDKNNNNNKYLYLECIIIMLDKFGTGLMINKENIKYYEREIFEKEIHEDIEFLKNVLNKEKNNININLKYKLINLIEKSKNNWKSYLFETVDKIDIKSIPKVSKSSPKINKKIKANFKYFKKKNF